MAVLVFPWFFVIGYCCGRQIREGTSRRGQKPQEDEEGSPIRGPICPDSIAGYVQDIAAHSLEMLFNGVVAILAARGFFPKQIQALLDTSEIQSTEQCEGCGMVVKEKAPGLRQRKGRIRKVLERVFGFKIWVLWDPNSRLPLALRFASIEIHDGHYVRELVEQALENLGAHATIASLAMDRGFIDGAFLWWLHAEKHIIFYIPAKKKMNVYPDALSLVEGGIRQVRERKRNVGAGKNRRQVIDRWEVVGIEGLRSAGFYGPDGSGSHENRKDFVANPINAVVVVHAILVSGFYITGLVNW